MKKTLFLFCLILLALPIGIAHAYTSNTLLAKALPDECFAGVGVNYPAPLSLVPFTCPANSVPKTNQTYVWGLTRNGNSLWVGTGANVMCTTEGLFLSPSPATHPPMYANLETVRLRERIRLLRRSGVTGVRLKYTNTI